VVLELAAEGALDGPPHPRHREGVHPVLQLPQLLDDLGIEQIRTRRHDLPELHEGRPEGGHALAQHAPLPVRDRRRAPLLAAHERPRDQADEVDQDEPGHHHAEDHEAADVPERLH
jgi:hypothetical protein